MKMLLIPHGVAPCGACRPWIFFINGVFFFLKINGSGMEKKIEEAKEHHLDENALIPHDVAPCGACRPWIFFINGVHCFLKFNDSGMEKVER